MMIWDLSWKIKLTLCIILIYNVYVRNIEWSEEKNARLKALRGIDFNDVVDAIENGDVLDTMDHPNQSKYPHQRILVVAINNYAYAVPFIQNGDKRFFKTAFPSRQATKKYLSNK